MRQRSAYFWEERNVWFSDLWEIRGTGQKMEAGKGRDRSAAFPLEVPYRLVNMYSSGQDVVLDPFAGLGTTALACMASARNSISVDVVPELADVARQRMLSSRTLLNELIDERLGRHRDFTSRMAPGTGYFNDNHAFPVKTRQETALQIDRIESIRLAEDGTVCCEYERQLAL